MKNGKISVIICCVLMIVLTACDGNVSDVKITEVKSDVYSEAEIKSAQKTVLDYFKKEYNGCKLFKLQYIGDEKNEEYEGFSDKSTGKVIVFVSDFKTGYKGVDGSFNSNYTYKGWKWILVQDSNSNWKVDDYGY